MRKSVLIAAVAMTVAAIATATYLHLTHPAANRSASTRAAPDQRPDFALKDLEGKTRHIGDWNGKVVLLNFWAPWCPPCRKEVPDFIRLQKKYRDKGVVIVGVAIDTRQNAQDFADTMGINYPILVGAEQGVKIAGRYGDSVGALPYSVVIDRAGHVVYRHRSELSYAKAQQIITPLL